jgi:phosphatidylglycerophosphatase C
MSQVARREVVVFDFDGTLVSRDSILDFSFRYCASRPQRLLLVAVVAPLAGLAWLRSTSAAASVLLWAMTFGTPTRRFVMALRRYAEQVLPRFAREPIFAELAHELTRDAQGDVRVVVATGTLPTIVRGLLRARGLPALPVAGSRFRRRWGGLVVQTHCVGKVKVRELGRRFGITAWARVYSDSLADRPLLRAARDIVLVAPSPRTLQSVQVLAGERAALRVLGLAGK